MNPTLCVAMSASLVVFGVSVQVAPSWADDDVGLNPIAFSRPVNLLTKPPLSVPTPRLRALCDSSQSLELCDIRTAAARRAWEIVSEENAASGTKRGRTVSRINVVGGMPLSLLVPSTPMLVNAPAALLSE